jgi:hypothetical protein
VRAVGPRAAEPAREVDVHDVEAARAQPQVGCRGVHHDVVAHRAGADKADVGDRRPPHAVDLDDHALLRRVTRAGLDHGPSPERQHASSSASTTSSIPSSAATLTRSVGSWLRSVPLARFVHAKPAASSALASEPPPVRIRFGV